MKIYKELESLGFFEWLSETHNLKDTDIKPEYLDMLPLNDIHRTVSNSMIFRWFREKYNLFHNIWNLTHGEPTDLIPNGFTFSIDEDWITIIGKNELGYFKKYYKTYEEAESACLDKLIKICKNK